MNLDTLHALFDELTKIAAERPGGVSSRIWRNVEYQFSEKAGPERWDKLVQRSSNPLFVSAFMKHPSTDPKLAKHVEGLHNLAKGEPFAKIKSFSSVGKSYEVRKTVSGLGCTCPDWRFRGSVDPSYECKHIRAAKSGQVGA